MEDTSDTGIWITNKTAIPVTVACKEMFGASFFSLRLGETKEIYFDLDANMVPAGPYSCNNPKYKIGKQEKWEIRGELGQFSRIKTETR